MCLQNNFQVLEAFSFNAIKLLRHTRMSYAICSDAVFGLRSPAQLIRLHDHLKSAYSQMWWPPNETSETLGTRVFALKRSQTLKRTNFFCPLGGDLCFVSNIQAVRVLCFARKEMSQMPGEEVRREHWTSTQLFRFISLLAAGRTQEPFLLFLILRVAVLCQVPKVTTFRSRPSSLKQRQKADRRVTRRSEYFGFG